MLSLRKARNFFVRHLHFVGPGLVSAVAYIDPGNWATDLAAGAEYGYSLLFVVLIAGLAAVVLQLLSVRLGAVTSLSLPAQTRLLFLRLQAKYPRYRIPLAICLYALYALAEIAIIGTDLAELLGSAIALNMLFPRLPLFAGVLITAIDVLIVLMFFRSNNGRQGMLLFEIVIVSLVVAVFVSFMILLHLVKPDWKEVFHGLVPSSTLVQPGALYVGIGIIGATVMPHALFLGSSLASVDRLNMLPRPPSVSPRRSIRLPRMLSLGQPLGLRLRRSPRRHSLEQRGEDESSIAVELDNYPSPMTGEEIIPADPRTGLPRAETDKMDDKNLDFAARTQTDVGASSDMFKGELEKAQKRYEAELRTFDRIRWVDLHLLHTTIDTTLSLLGFALIINASILTLAGAAYYYGDTGASADDASLQGAHDLIKSYVGNAAAVIFALALLCAGQSASITATLAGQVVSEGFINWKTSPFLRRLITRLIGVIPAAAIAAAIGEKGLNTMLVASQVLLSIVLPTVIFPLVYLCSRKDIMTVDGPLEDCVVVAQVNPAEEGTRGNEASASAIPTLPTPMSPNLGCLTLSSPYPAGLSQALPIRSASSDMPLSDATQAHQSPAQRRRKSYVSPTWVTCLGYALFGVVVMANGYVIVQLGLGNG